MPVTHGVASSSLVQTANPNRESLSPNGWGTFAFLGGLIGGVQLVLDVQRGNESPEHIDLRDPSPIVVCIESVI